MERLLSALVHPQRPFSPTRVPFFYGWVIAAVGTVGILMSIPGQTTGVSVFTDPLLRATGLGRLNLSNAYLIGTAASGFLLPMGGRWVDRYGVRPAAVAASLMLATTLVFLSQIDRIGGFFGSTTWLLFSLLAIGFTALRFSGQGMLTLVSRTMIGRWFDRRRGVVAGVSGVFVSFGFSSAPLLLAIAIDTAGFRSAWIWLALLVGAGMSLIAYVFFRDTPESVGLEVDGGATDVATPAFSADARDHTRDEAVRTRAFWAIAATLGTQGLTITGFTFHVVDLGAEAGLERSEAVAMFLPMSVVSTVLGVAIGWLGDRMPVRRLLVAMALFEVVAVLAAVQLHTDIGRWIAIGCLGAASAFFGPLSTLALPRYFGRLHLGAINGALMSVLVIASAIGPSLFAVGHLSGSYTPGLLACAGLAGIALTLSAGSGPREPR